MMTMTAGRYWLTLLLPALSLLAGGSHALAREVDAVAVVEQLGLTELALALAPQAADPAAPAAPAVLLEADARAFLDSAGLGRALEDGAAATLAAHPVFVASARAEAATATRSAAQTQAFEQLLFQALSLDLTTGYNIFPEGVWPDYAPERSLVYGHNRLKHLRQLLFLLRVKGLDPAFTIVPKTSAFKIREAWGVPAGETPQLPDGTRVAQLAEYDLVLEFASPAELLRFQELVTRYAKKDTEEESGLLYSSWWQPFYRSRVASGAMRPTREIWLSMDGHRANVLSLPAEEAPKTAGLSALSGDWQIEVIDLWVNPSFYRYLEGGYR